MNKYKHNINFIQFCNFYITLMQHYLKFSNIHCKITYLIVFDIMMDL